MPGRTLSFVLAACDDGPMILSRFDFYRDGDKLVKGVGLTLLDEGSQSQHALDVLIQLSHERRRLRGDGVTVLDCGANVGTFTVGWAKAMAGWGEVIAIEAQERIFYALAGNIALNNLFNARAVFAAVTDQDGFVGNVELDYCQPGHFSGTSLLRDRNLEVGQKVKIGHGRPTRALSIDGMALRRLDLIKIDVEGMERQVLEGGRATIERERPFILAEHIYTTPEDIAAGLPAGYRWEKIGGDIIAMPGDDPVWNRLRIVEAA